MTALADRYVERTFFDERQDVTGLPRQSTHEAGSEIFGNLVQP